jgi:hypothetical protein
VHIGGWAVSALSAVWAQVACGADLVNDVSAGRFDPDMRAAVNAMEVGGRRRRDDGELQTAALPAAAIITLCN